MKIVGHYNIQHINPQIKVVVLDLSETEDKYIHLSSFESKIITASEDAKSIISELFNEFPSCALYNFDIRKTKLPLWFWDKIFFLATSELPIKYFVSKRPNDITTRIRFPLECTQLQYLFSNPFSTSSSSAKDNSNFDDQKLKLPLMRLLQWKHVNINDEKEVMTALKKYESITELLR